MSQAEIDRFTAAVGGTPSLLDAYMDVRSPAEMAARLQSAGYDVSAAEVEAAVLQGVEAGGVPLDAKMADAELADAELDGVTGGSVLLPIGIGLGVAAFCAIPALVAGTVAVGLVVAKKLGARID